MQRDRERKKIKREKVCDRERERRERVREKFIEIFIKIGS